MSRQELADAASVYLDKPVDAKYLGKLERGDHRWPNEHHRRAIRQALGAASDAELGFYITRPQPRVVEHDDSDLGRPTVDSSTGTQRIASVPLDAHSDALSTMQWLRSADSQLGGGHLYPAVARYLQQVLAPQLFAGSIDPQAGNLYAAAAALSEMAGWMAHDAAGDAYAWQHFGQALAMARASRDDQLHAHVLGSLSHLANHAGRPEQAIQLAQQGQHVGQGRSHPGVIARLHAMQARGHAGLLQNDLCTVHLQRAQATLAGTSGADVSPWVSSFDQASLATETARCMQFFGQWQQARHQVEQVIALRPPDRVRSRSLAQLTLARILVAQGKPDEACGAAADVLDATRTLGSDQILQQFEELDRRLIPYSASHAVAGFRDRLSHELRLRRLFHHWQPTSDSHQPSRASS